MSRISAGLLMYRVRDNQREVLLGHPGGPFFAKKNDGIWTIPKGEIEADEDILEAARREFEEETGLKPEGDFTPLTPIKQKSGKVVYAWAFEGDCDPNGIRSNTFQLEWPPNSGRFQSCPELDRACFFPIETAKQRINPAQIPLLEELARRRPLTK